MIDDFAFERDTSCVRVKKNVLPSEALGCLLRQLNYRGTDLQMNPQI